MGTAERIYEMVRNMPEEQAEEILNYANRLKALEVPVHAARRRLDLKLFRRYRGRYDGGGIDRDSLHDRDRLR